MCTHGIQRVEARDTKHPTVHRMGHSTDLASPRCRQCQLTSLLASGTLSEETPSQFVLMRKLTSVLVVSVWNPDPLPFWFYHVDRLLDVLGAWVSGVESGSFRLKHVLGVISLPVGGNVFLEGRKPCLFSMNDRYSYKT